MRLVKNWYRLVREWSLGMNRHHCLPCRHEGCSPMNAPPLYVCSVHV
jgi:hypothetical protein